MNSIHGQLLASLSLCFLAACGSASGSSPPPASPPLLVAIARLGTDPYCTTVLKAFSVEVADTDDERIEGLSGRMSPLDRNKGMLFDFQSPVQDSFYMRDTYIPLSIGFFDSDRKLIQSFEMPVESNPSKPTHLYAPGSTYVSALEAPPGTFKNLEPGSTYLCVS